MSVVDGKSSTVEEEIKMKTGWVIIKQKITSSVRIRPFLLGDDKNMETFQTYEMAKNAHVLREKEALNMNHHM